MAEAVEMCTHPLAVHKPIRTDQEEAMAARHRIPLQNPKSSPVAVAPTLRPSFARPAPRASCSPCNPGQHQPHTPTTQPVKPGSYLLFQSWDPKPRSSSPCTRTFELGVSESAPSQDEHRRHR
ncbi:hypothetical protein PYCCODRAFT_1440896 [Trametes coccinea BRFM310]|uniref:Uncharacterized protein n=1 Tax=Trametes coccinea (strain BRFM310) TaxID=1353009 RepID=A0A1Y2I6A3_TRAC3|nr:hypothetical protein PYCCODRAFT_1440896 [Trametes coccinea BRFM310]